VKLCLQFEELGQFGVFSFGLLATCMKEIIATCEEAQCGHWTSVDLTVSHISQKLPLVVNDESTDEV